MQHLAVALTVAAACLPHAASYASTSAPDTFNGLRTVEDGAQSAEYPYSDVLNDATDTGGLRTEDTSTKPGNSTKPPPLRCVVYPGEGIGTRINCEAVCREVCKGLVECPCNDNGRGIDCWVPRDQAKTWCAAIPECHVISTYRGSPDSPAPSYLDTWAQLGDAPVAKKKGFVASVCDKEEAGICFDCPDGTGNKKETCHKATYSAATYSPSQAFCSAGMSVECMQATDARQCTMTKKAYCNTDLGECVKEAPLCTMKTIKALLSAGGTLCDQWVKDVLSRRKPSLSSTCGCLKSIQSVLNTKAALVYECAMVPNTRTLAYLAERACEDDLMPCTEGDACEGCVNYKATATNAGVAQWLPLKVAGFTKKCAVHADTNTCVMVGTDKTLKPHMPCAADLSSVDMSDAVYYLSPPVDAGWGRSRKRGGLTVEEPHVPFRGTPAGSTHAPPPNRTMEENLGVPPPDEGLPVDFNHSDIGNAIAHRHYMDAANRTVNVVMTCSSFPDDGTVDSWSLYAGRSEGRVHAQVLRPVDIPADLKDNPHVVTAYKVVGENLLHVTRPGPNTFVVPADTRIDVKAGDIIGFYSRGLVSWSEGGERILFRYGNTSNPTMGNNPMVEDRAYVSDSLLFVGDGVLRSYSFSANGQFPGHHVPVTPSPSPSPAATPSPSVSQPPSMSTSPSPSPAASPSAKSRCLEGPSYWCQDRTLRHFCNVTERVYERQCPELPKCDPSARCPAGMLPKTLLGPHSSRAPSTRCFDPALDCTRSPCAVKTGANHSRGCDMYAFNTVHGFAESTKPAPRPPTTAAEAAAQEAAKVASPVCPGAPYCSGGQDWTGRCARGKAQSPIKVEWAAVDEGISTMQVVEPAYSVQDVVMSHTGWGMVVSGDLGSLLMDGVEWDAVAMSIHAPAEHQVEGRPRADVELQIMHNMRHTLDGKDYGAQTMGLSIFLDSAAEGEMGSTEQGIKLFGSRLPSEAGETIIIRDLDLNQLVSTDKPRMLYTGSLTTPPCSEGVMWSLQLGQNERLSKAAIGNINAVFRTNAKFAMGRGNNRALQKLNGRSLKLKSSCGANSAIACPTGGALTMPSPSMSKSAKVAEMAAEMSPGSI